MSTYWGYVCETHDPPIVSERWFNRGETVLHRVFELERAGEWPNVPESDPLYLAYEGEPMPVHQYADDLIGTTGPYGVGTPHPVMWLREHPRCKVALRNEYGDREEL